MVFDTIAAAKARGCDVIICDTAGRLHNKKNLMDELGKISRVIDRELPGCDRETLLVLDAATGQNAVNQAREFQSAAGITGIVLTKLDGTPKGGVVLPIMQDLGLPVKFIGVGEQVDDLQPLTRMPLPMPCLTTSGTTPPSLPRIGRLPSWKSSARRKRCCKSRSRPERMPWRARSCSSSWRSAPSPRRACSPISTHAGGVPSGGASGRTPAGEEKAPLLALWPQAG